MSYGTLISSSTLSGYVAIARATIARQVMRSLVCVKSSGLISLFTFATQVGFGRPTGLFVGRLYSFKAWRAGVSCGNLYKCPSQFRRLRLIVLLHGSLFVLLYRSTFVILSSFVILRVRLSRVLWKTSILCSSFIVIVHSSLLYRKIEHTYALKILILVVIVALLL